VANPDRNAGSWSLTCNKRGGRLRDAHPAYPPPLHALGDETVAQNANQLFYISKEALKRRQIDELWKAKRATAPKSLANVVLSNAVTESIRKELRRTTGQNVEGAQIIRLMKETVLRPECFT